jgi:hypothetical protein
MRPASSIASTGRSPGVEEAAAGMQPPGSVFLAYACDSDTSTPGPDGTT